jgi:hypothetical protein
MGQHRGKTLTVEAIAGLVLYSVWHVKLVWTQYFKEGASALLTKPRGGRRRENIALQRFNGFLEEAIKKL